MSDLTITGMLAKKDSAEKNSLAIFMPRKATKSLSIEPEYVSKRHIEKYTISKRVDGVFFATITFKQESSWMISRVGGLGMYIHNVSNWPLYSENIEEALYLIGKFDKSLLEPKEPKEALHFYLKSGYNPF